MKKLHPYIPHLIEDIKAAQRKNDSQFINPPSIEDHFREVEQYVRGAPEDGSTLGELCGLSMENFPPAHQLAEHDMEVVLDAFHQLLESWNICMHLPVKMPFEKQYAFIFKMLNEQISPLSFGTINYDFCTGDSEGCELEEYCPCLEFRDD